MCGEILSHSEYNVNESVENKTQIIECDSVGARRAEIIFNCSIVLHRNIISIPQNIHSRISLSARFQQHSHENSYKSSSCVMRFYCTFHTDVNWKYAHNNNHTDRNISHFERSAPQHICQFVRSSESISFSICISSPFPPQTAGFSKIIIIV